MVEFVLVGALLLVVFGSIVQLGLYLYVRNTLVAAAAEGARVAAQAGHQPGDGERATRELIGQTLGPGYPVTASAGLEVRDGVPTTYVEVRAAVPVVGLAGPHRLVLRGHAVQEPP